MITHKRAHPDRAADAGVSPVRLPGALAVPTGAGEGEDGFAKSFAW
jgi:hypothetical protein